MTSFSDVHIKQHSQGTTNVFFIHGYGEVSEMWNDTIAYLSSSESDISVYTIDLPGFGNSPITSKLENLRDVSDAVSDTLNNSGIDSGRFIGHSLGGYVLMHLINYHPEKVDAACFMNSSVFADTDAKKRQRDKVIDFLEANGTAAFIENFIPGLFYEQNRKACDTHIADAIEQGKTISTESMIRYMQMMRDRSDLSDSLRSFEKPVHFIIGKNDESVPFNISSAQISIPPMSTALILEDCGHMAMFENKDATYSSLRSFVNI
jgi:pimeloyl-ACP methyl ester carboxylesterase